MKTSFAKQFHDFIIIHRAEIPSHHRIHQLASTTNRQFHQEEFLHPCLRDSRASRRSQKFKFARRQRMEMVSSYQLKLRTIASTIFISPSTEDHYSNTPSNRPYSLQQPQSRAPLVGTNGSNGNGTEEVWLRQSEGRSSGESKS